MNISENGLKLIKDFEGCRLDAYLPTPDDVLTIGYGHTSSVIKGMTITSEEADDLLKLDIKWAVRAVNKRVEVDLSQNQFDALCSFTFNLGETNLRTSTLLKKLNSLDYLGSGNELLRWNKQAGKALKGLTRRREAERELFNA